MKTPRCRAIPKLLALTCLSLVYINAWGQNAVADRALQAVVLNPVVVSGSRSEQPRDDLPMSMDVMTAADLQDGQISDIHDLAKSLPNVSVKHAPTRFTVTGAGNTTGRDGNAGFNVRGQDGNRVLLLVDGVRLPRSYINGNNAFGRDLVDLGLLKRVELVRGPSSVLYGSDALAGMVNFISHDPVDFLNGVGAARKTLGGEAAYAYNGADQAHRLSATLAGNTDDSLQWLLTATAGRAHGVDNMGSNDAANVDRTRPNPQTDHNGSVLGKLVFKPGTGQKHVLTFEHMQKTSDVELLSSRAKAPLVAASVVGESARQEHQRDRMTWDARYALDRAWADQLQTTLSFQAGTAQDNGHTRRYDGGVRLRDTAYDERAWQASAQFSKALPISAQWSQKITYGLDLASTNVSSWFDGFDPKPLPTYLPKKYFPDTRDSTAALYAQSEISDARWAITPGLRAEYFSLNVLSQDGFAPPSPTPGKSLSGSNVSPKLGALYRVTPQWSVFAHYASGFRAPNATQINGFTENPTLTTFVKLLSNPDLKPETSRNVELGVRARLERLHLDAAVFSGNFKDLIVDKKPLGGAGVAGDPLLFQTVNVDRARIQGFEFKGTVDLGDLAGGAWSSSFAYGQAKGTDRSTNLPLNAIDPAKLALGLKYSAARWDVSVDAVHHAAKTESDLDSPYLAKPATAPRKKQFTVPAANTLDMQVQYRVQRDLRVYLGVFNLNNRKYWLWSDVQGLDAASTAVDAYTQAGRHAKLSVVWRY